MRQHRCSTRKQWPNTLAVTHPETAARLNRCSCTIQLDRVSGHQTRCRTPLLSRGDMAHIWSPTPVATACSSLDSLACCRSTAASKTCQHRSTAASPEDLPVLWGAAGGITPGRQLKHLPNTRVYDSCHSLSETNIQVLHHSMPQCRAVDHHVVICAQCRYTSCRRAFSKATNHTIPTPHRRRQRCALSTASSCCLVQLQPQLWARKHSPQL